MRFAVLAIIALLLASGIGLVLWMNRSTYAKSTPSDLGRIYDAVLAYTDVNGDPPATAEALRDLDGVEEILRSMERARGADAVQWLEYHPEVKAGSDILLRDRKTGIGVRADGTETPP
jgi:hypothetical protein